jgi:hypothetical protein
MIRAAERIYSMTGPVAESVIVLGGDNLHADNRNNQTERSRHALDVDTRYQRSIEAITEGMTTAIETALSVSGAVTVYVLSGNHDHHASIGLALILAAYYRNEPRVTIDTSPSKHRLHVFGGNAFLYSHGDTGTEKRLAGYMLQRIIQGGITGVDRMLVRLGHLHQRSRAIIPDMTEESGVVIERFPTLAAPDSFAHEQAYVNQRMTVANLWHRKHGLRSRMEIGVGELVDN